MDMIPNTQPYVALIRSAADPTQIFRMPVVGWSLNKALIVSPHVQEGDLAYAHLTPGFLRIVPFVPNASGAFVFTDEMQGKTED
jgi:hypothetical protein